MTTLSTFLDAGRQADLARDPDWISAEKAYADLHKALRAKFGEHYRPTGHPLDPTTSEDETSLQPLGDTQALVIYKLDPGVVVFGVLLDGGFVDACEFSDQRVLKWTRAIQAEVAKDEEIAGWDE